MQPQPRQPVLRQNKLRIFRFRACTEAKDTQLASTRSSRAPCAFPNLRCYPRCWLFSCFGFEFPTPLISPKEHQKERCGHYSVAALLHYVLWCASEYSVVGRISCHDSHDSTRTNVCQWSFAKKFLLLLLLNRIDSIRNLFIIFALDFPALENPISEKTNCRIQPSSHSYHASSSSSNQSGLSSERSSGLSYSSRRPFEP